MLVPVLLGMAGRRRMPQRAGLGVSWLVARGAGLGRAERRTLAIELGIENSTLGILIAVTAIGAGEIAVPSAVYGLLMYLSAAVEVVVGRRTVDSGPHGGRHLTTRAEVVRFRPCA